MDKGCYKSKIYCQSTWEYGRGVLQILRMLAKPWLTTWSPKPILSSISKVIPNPRIVHQDESWPSSQWSKLATQFSTNQVTKSLQCMYPLSNDSTLWFNVKKTTNIQVTAQIKVNLHLASNKKLTPRNHQVQNLRLCNVSTHSSKTYFSAQGERRWKPTDTYICRHSSGIEKLWNAQWKKHQWNCC